MTRSVSAQDIVGAWVAGYGQYLVQAAGRDGRLSDDEMRRAVSVAPPVNAAYAEAAGAIFEPGQKSMRTTRALGRGVARAAQALTAAAGPNGKLSLREMRQLPGDLRTSALALRAQRLAGPPVTSTESAKVAIDTAIKPFLDAGYGFSDGEALLSTRIISGPTTLDELKSWLANDRPAAWSEPLDGVTLLGTFAAAMSGMQHQLRLQEPGAKEATGNGLVVASLNAAISTALTADRFSMVAYLTTEATGSQYNRTRHSLAARAADGRWLLIEADVVS